MSEIHRRALTILAALLASLHCATGSAGLLESHNWVGTRIITGPTDSTVIHEGTGLLDTGEQAGSAGDAAAAAQAISAPGALRAASIASQPESDAAFGQGLAVWRDAVYLPSGLEPPEFLRFSFRVDAILQADKRDDAPFDVNTWAELGIDVDNDPDDRFSLLSSEPGELLDTGTEDFQFEATLYQGSLQQDESSPGGLEPDEDGFSADTGSELWKSSDYDDGMFEAMIEWEAEPIVSDEVYTLTVTTSLRSNASGGAARADALNTVTLESVSLPDGTPIFPTFDSGFELTSEPVIPEPSSLALLGIGATGLFGYRWRRKRKHKAATEQAA